jgi:hypothetical protein
MNEESNESGMPVRDADVDKVGANGQADSAPVMNDRRLFDSIAGTVGIHESSVGAFPFKPSVDLTAIIEGLATGDAKGEVVAIGLDRCHVSIASAIDDRDRGRTVSVSFKHSHDGWMCSHRRQAVLRAISASRDSTVLDLLFSEPVSLEDSESLGNEFSTPHPLFAMSKQRAWAAQLELAKLDIEQLSALSRESGASIITLLLSSISAFAVIIGLFFALIQGFGVGGAAEIVNRHPTLGSVLQWAVVLAALPGVIAVPFMIVFLERIAAVHAYDAFRMLLQRSIYCGEFPACYRGWQDAFANFNRLRKYGPGSSKYFDGIAKTHPPVTKSVNGLFPAHSFTTIAALVFLVTPYVSVIMICVELWSQSTASWQHALVALFGAGGCVLLSVVFAKLLWNVRYGNRSFDYLLVVYSRILHHAPPYPAQERGPLMWREHDRRE